MAVDVGTLDKPALVELLQTWNRKLDDVAWDDETGRDRVIEDELARRIKKVDGPHCQQCGARIGVDAGAWDGYTSCCNERVVYSCEPGRDCSHGMY